MNFIYNPPLISPYGRPYVLIIDYCLCAFVHLARVNCATQTAHLLVLVASWMSAVWAESPTMKNIVPTHIKKTCIS